MAATGYADVVSVEPWELAEQNAGLSNPAVLVAYPGSGAITLPSGTYQNYIFTCTSLIIPNNNTKLVNCQILCSDPNYGIRLDANTGQEVGRYLEHCEVTATGVAFAGAGFTARLCKVVNNGDDSARIGRSHAEPTIFELCHFSDFRPNTGAHADGCQVETQPGADVILYGCSISMNTAAGYTLPSGAGYTGALFVAFDVPIAGGDPEPTRFGGVWASHCKMVSSNNYTVVVDEHQVDIRDCVLLPGTTAIESINNGVTVTGANNVDGNGTPIADTNIHGDPRTRFVTVADPRITLAGLGDVDTSGVTDGQVLAWDAAESLWEPATVAGGGGSSTLAGLSDVNVAGVTDGQVLEWVAAASRWEPRTVTGGSGSTITTVSAYITNGNINLPNTSGAWQEVTEADNITPMELAVPAAVGNRAAIEFNAMRTGANAVDIGVMVGSQIRRFMSTGTATPALDGDLGWYDQGGSFALHGGRRSFVVTSNDLDSGHVRFAMVTKGTGTGTIEASADDTFYWEATVIA